MSGSPTDASLLSEEQHQQQGDQLTKGRKKKMKKLKQIKKIKKILIEQMLHPHI
jgi:hypothetical protein